MKFNWAVIALCIACFSCGTQKNLNQNVVINEETIMIEHISKKGLTQAPYQEWFAPNYNSSKPDATVIAQLKPLLKDIKIKAFMGTWCSDSQIEIPNLIKILENSNYNFKNLSLIAMDRDKTTPNALEKGLDIQYVPTIILYKNGKELHRIVEIAMETLEKDMLNIAKGAPYKHAYED